MRQFDETLHRIALPRAGFLARACDHAAKRALIAAGMVFALLAPVHAQQIDCRDLQSQIAVYPQSEGEARARQAIDQRAREIDRLRAQAQSMGCERQQFMFFNQPPAACASIAQQVQSLRANLAQLEAQAQRAGGGRSQLIAQYNARCGNRTASAPPRQRGFLEQLFGGEAFRQEALEAPGGMPDPIDEGPQRGSKAVCVRTCDGGFFPVSYSAGRGNADQLADLCKAQCPFAETRVYTYSPARDIVDAISSEGEPYTSHPNALRFRRTFDKTCTCRPPDTSWAEALAGAEKLLQRDRRDVIVTQEKSDELARPRNLRPNIAPTGLAPTGAAPANAAPATQKPPPPRRTTSNAPISHPGD